MKNIFSGVRVIDLTKVFSGPFATRMLADYGAEVIKIENSKNYDDSRDFPPLKNGWSGYYEILNRNKKSISLNLKNNLDLQKLYTLSESADVFVENLSPASKHHLKIDYESLRKYNSKIIYASLSGYTQESNKKYYDVIVQAESGLMSLTGSHKMPTKIGPSVVDAFSGMTLAFAISSALYYRQKTELGQYIDVSMFGSAMNLLESNLIDYSITKINPKRTGNVDNLISPFGVYKASDGYITIAIGNQDLWQKFLNFLLDNSQITDVTLFASNSLRLKNNHLLSRYIEESFSKYPVKKLEIELSNIGIPNSKINNMSDVYTSIANFKNNYLIKLIHPNLGECVVPGASIKFSNSDTVKVNLAPEIGQNNFDYGL